MQRLEGVREQFYRHTLFFLLGFTRALAGADFNVPSKWYSVFENLRVSSNVIHDRIAAVDEDVEQEFRQVENQIERRMGKQKFYSEEEIKELQERIKEIRI